MTAAVITSPELVPAQFREVLGRYPTGVCVVTAQDSAGPVGMVVGSFSSASLDPPLVAFFADKGSTSWPRIQQAKAFCVNVLSAHQRDLCGQFAARGGDKFTGVEWSAGLGDAPILDGCPVTIEADIAQVVEVGDHFLVVGHVSRLNTGPEVAPMLFLTGRLGVARVDCTAGPPLRALDLYRWH